MNNNRPADLKIRTKDFALRIVKLTQSLPESQTGEVMGKQLLWSGTSVGAQYREAKRARSKAEFASKVQAAIQELDETSYWLKLLIGAGLVEEKRLSDLLDELNQIMSMLVASSKTVKKS